MVALDKQINIRHHTKTNQFFDQYLAQDVSLRMMLVPSGSFQMGSPEDESERFDAEGPQHLVNLQQFFLGKYPITEFQWDVVTELPEQNRPIKPRSTSKANHPVSDISWLEAVEFCDRLTAHTGRPYRLPTEAEWEYACRAGTTTPFHFGETISLELANYRSETSYNEGPTGQSPGGTTLVGQYGVANAFGLSDMHGNVWEWCQDNWHNNYDGAPSDGRPWGNDAKGNHVIRGGSWDGLPRHCRSASRYSGTLDDFVGFRVACSAPRT